MKKILCLLSLLASVALMISCDKKEDKEIKIGVTFYPMQNIMTEIQEDLKKDGYTVKFVQTDLTASNKALSNGELDVNLIQHKYYMETFNKSITDNNKKLTIVQPIYHMPLRLYSPTITKVEDIKPNTTIIIPNDPDNIARSLNFLQSLNLLKLKSGVTTNAKESDIVSKSEKINIVTEPLNTLSSKYLSFKGEVMAVMYYSYAKFGDGKLMEDKQVVSIEELTDTAKTYAISMASRVENKDSEKVKALIKHLKASQKAKDWLAKNYKSAVIAF